MSVYVSILSRSGDDLPGPEVFNDYLPLDPGTHRPMVHQFDAKKSRLIVWQWGAAIDRKPVRTEEGVLFVQGYGDTEARTVEDRVRSALRNHEPIDDSYGSFASVVHDLSGVRAFSSRTGMDPIYVLNHGSFVALSNRTALLAALASFTVRREALMSLCGRTHLQDYGSVYNELSRVAPGGSVRVSLDGSVQEHRGSLLDIFETWDIQESAEELEPTMERFAHTLKTIGLPLQISLSGGKDSRAILAILDRAGCFDDTVQVETQGHWYDPEVLAAQDLMELYQHPADRHAVIRPSYVDSPEHLVPALVDTLFAWEGNMSLADREKYRLDNGHLTVGGHELGMKYWGNPAPLETYVKSPVFKVNTSGLLGEHAHQERANAYASLLMEVLAGTPQEKYSIVEAWAFRNPNFVAHDFLRRNVSEYEFHPLLDISFLRLLLNCPTEMTTNQVWHYLIMSKANKPLHNVAFAGDAWPPELVTSLSRLEQKPEGLRVRPYEFRKEFPNARGRGLFNWRIETLRMSQGYMKEALARHAQLFDFLDERRLDELLSMNPREATITDLYGGLGLLNAVLQADYGDELLKRTNRQSLVEELTDRFSYQKATPTAVEASSEYKEALDNYDRSLAYFVRQNRELAGEPRRLHEQLCGMRNLDNDDCTIELALDDGAVAVELRATIVTAEGESRKAALASIRVDAKPISGPGVFLSDDPDVGSFVYLPTTDGSAKQVSISIPVEPGSQNVEVVLRTWSSLFPVFVGDLELRLHAPCSNQE